MAVAYRRCQAGRARSTSACGGGTTRGPRRRVWCRDFGAGGDGMHRRSKPTLPLLGRQREREVLDDLLDDLRSGRGWALVVRGEAGAGKSALLGYGVGPAPE